MADDKPLMTDQRIIEESWNVFQLMLPDHICTLPYSMLSAGMKRAWSTAMRFAIKEVDGRECKCKTIQ